MKKFLFPALLALCLLLLNACHAGINKARSSEQYAGYITGGTYYIHFYRDILVDAEVQKTEFEAAQLGGSVSERSGASPARFGITEPLESYLVNYQTKTVTRYTERLTPEFFGAFDFTGLAYISSGRGPDEDAPYAYDEYATDAGVNVRFCFDGGALAGLMLLNNGEAAAAITVLELTDKIPAYMFDIPEGFAVVEGG